ncbi:hypothetical protein C8J56DRAFT_822859 [Mycena floridula]|nr:hypothetical protein C8J56DRAFT_822859 [Mycena floridula]
MNIPLLLIVALFLERGQAVDPCPRWAQAASIINSDLFVQGGKTDPFNSFSYTSAPSNNDLFLLSLSDPFEASSPPWQLTSSSTNMSSPQGPPVAWHTLSAFNTSFLLLFGGVAGPNSDSPSPSLADSAWILDVYNRPQPQWTDEATFWAGEPTRRAHHSAITVPDGRVYIVGGERADGSGIPISEHYIFDVNVPSFTQLAATGGPQAITRHGSVILSNGTMLVFGGYDGSASALTSFSTIWALDTTQSSASWTTLTVSGPVPPGRRDFATTLVEGSKVVIHGGNQGAIGDPPGPVLDDGWIMDTSQNPATWTQVDALTQIGKRSDHMAVAYGPLVFFSCGYGPSGPAPAGMLIYDVDSNSWVTSYKPPDLPITTQTIPGASQTTRAPQSTSTGADSGTITSPGAPNPTSTSKNPQESQRIKKTTAVAIGVVLGVLGLAAVVVLVILYYRRQRRDEDARRAFMAIPEDGDDESPHFATSPPGIWEKHRRGSESWNALKNLGIAGAIGTLLPRNATRVERRDMLADEDTRAFGYDLSRRGSANNSAWSLRSMLGRPKNRMPSGSSTLGRVDSGRWSDKDPFSDGAALMGDEETGFIGAAVPGATRPHSKRQWSHTSSISNRSWVDPFADPIPEETYHDEFPYPATNLEIQTMLPMFPTGPHALSPVTEVSRSMSFDSSSRALSQEMTPSPFDTVSSGTSFSSPRPGSIIDSAPTQPMRRSDSWWARFSRTSIMDRRPSGRSNHMLDIRDPNPPPRLHAIEESQNSGSPDDKDSPGSGSRRSNSLRRGLSNMLRKNPSAHSAHRHSLSSMRTADSEAIDRIAGGMDVAVRTGSNRTRESTGTSMGSQSDDPHWLPEEDPVATALSPVPVTSPVQVTPPDHPLAQLTPPKSPSPESSALSLSSGTSSNTANRIKEYERRLSQDMMVPPPTNTKQREERSRKKSKVDYGLVPRASLFVANPDHQATASGDS